jgi:PadR family transcriptional regulator AphA
MEKLQPFTAKTEVVPVSEQPGKRSREKASRFALLGMLSLGGKQSGYDLKKAIASSTAHFWSESYGNIYPRLRDLLDEELIRPHTPTPADTARRKQVYSITAKGRQALAAWLSEPVVPRHEDNELLLKLFFGSRMPTQSAPELVKANRANHERLLQQFDVFTQNILSGPLHDEEKVFLEMTVEYGRAVSKALIDWAKKTEGLLSKLHHASPDQ